ncbi:unnamed protein product [Vicia faba]|uniref:Uncharacterized protein n=1 Tax=Vicia faba TaxID=3906 RepID=A0AAV0Z3C2_VICFA|nr:unnamed protein product [Vicia faba]
MLTQPKNYSTRAMVVIYASNVKNAFSLISLGATDLSIQPSSSSISDQHTYSDAAFSILPPTKHLRSTFRLSFSDSVDLHSLISSDPSPPHTAPSQTHFSEPSSMRRHNHLPFSVSSFDFKFRFGFDLRRLRKIDRRQHKLNRGLTKYGAQI